MKSSEPVALGFIVEEPKGVDFIIQSEPLTQETRQEISDFIRAYKVKHNSQPLKSKGRQLTTTVNSNPTLPAG